MPIDLTQFEWSELRYQELEDRNREIAPAEEMRFWAELRADFQPLVELYLVSGRRRSDWVTLTKDRVNLETKTVRVPSRKKKKPGELTVELTDQEFEMISQEMAKSPAGCAHVFTYEVQGATA